MRTLELWAALAAAAALALPVSAHAMPAVEQGVVPRAGHVSPRSDHWEKRGWSS